jgi:hypothetical protein
VGALHVGPCAVVGYRAMLAPRRSRGDGGCGFPCRRCRPPAPGRRARQGVRPITAAGRGAARPHPASVRCLTPIKQ